MLRQNNICVTLVIHQCKKHITVTSVLYFVEGDYFYRLRGIKHIYNKILIYSKYKP